MRAALPASPVLLSGRLGEVNVAALLQAVSLLGLAAVRVRLRSLEGLVADVHLDGDVVVDASMEGERGMAVLRRVVEWSDGRFFVARETGEPEETIGESVTKCLLETLSWLDLDRELGSEPEAAEA